MLENMLQQFRSFYEIPGLTFPQVLMAVGLALVFAAIWLTIYRTWHYVQGWWVWALVISAALTWSAVAFIQIPLQTWSQEFLVNRMGMQSFIQWLWLTGLPIILLSGLVQEAAKLVPVIILWYSRNKQLDPLTGFYAGAIAGAGFGIFEAVWVHNMIFASGWSWSTVTMAGTGALLGFWERLFTLGLHIAVSALAGYGWAKGLKWQYYLIAAGLHSLANYAVILLNQGNLTGNQAELYIALVTIAATVYAFIVLRQANRPLAIPLVVENNQLTDNFADPGAFSDSESWNPAQPSDQAPDSGSKSEDKEQG
jgi:RsiW-degrading membrane proteinase PrsW (M82 family)